MSDEDVLTLKAKVASLERALNHLTGSVQIAHVASRSLDLPNTLSELVEAIHNQFGYYQTSLFLYDERRNLLIMRAAAGPVVPSSPAETITFPPSPHSIIGWVALNRTAHLAPYVQQDSLYRPVSNLPATHSELALPLITQDKLLGVLDVQSQVENDFQAEDVAALQLMVDQVALALENSQLFTTVRSRLTELETLFTLSETLSSTLDVNEIYRRATRIFAERMPVLRAVISEWDQEQDLLITKGNYYFEPGKPGEYEIAYLVFPVADYPTSRRVLAQHQTVHYQIDDPTLEEAQKELLASIGSAAAVEVPLAYGGRTFGMVELYGAPDLKQFSSYDIQLAEAMARETAVALHNAQVASEARTRVAELSTLNRFSLAISQAKDVRAVYHAAQREILSLIEATGMSVVLADLENQTMKWDFGFEYGQEVDLSGVGPLPISQGFSGYVAQTGNPLLINEKMEEKQVELGSFTVGSASSAWLGVPLRVTDQLIGILSVENADDPNVFTERDMQLLQTIATPLAISIQNELLLEQTRAALRVQSQQSLWLRTAAEVAAAASGRQTITDLIQAVVDLIPERFNLYYAGLFLIDPNSQYAVLHAGTGEAGRRQREQHRQLLVGGNSLIGRATGDGVPRIEQDVTQSRDWLYNPNLPLTRSELALPLRTPTHIIGALTVQSVEPNTFSPELVDVLQIMCDQIAVAIDNTQLLARAEARARQQQLLNEVSATLYRSADVEKIVSVGLQALTDHLLLSGATLRLGQVEISEQDS